MFLKVLRGWLGCCSRGWRRVSGGAQILAHEL